MSWEIFIQDLPEVTTIAEVPKDFRPSDIGDRAELERGILAVIPYAQFQDEWCFARTSGVDLSIQFHRGENGQVRYILVHVHEGENSATTVAALIKHLGLRAIDTATGELFDTASLDEGL